MKRRQFVRAGAAVGVAGLGSLAGLPGSARSLDVPLRGHRGPPDGVLRLNSNENPLGLCPAARQAIVDTIPDGNRYPGELRSALMQALASKHEVTEDSIVLGNGSTEILQMIVQAATSPNATLVLADPTFEHVAGYQRPFPYLMEKVLLDGRHAHDIQQMRDKAQGRRRPAVVYLCNPNNPTGTLTPSAEIDAWIDEAPETVLFAVDEAYFEYADDPGYWSTVKWTQSRPNVVVVRTFSKIYGMAGLRLGYAIAHPDTAGRLRDFVANANANQLALAAALASLNDAELERRSREANSAARKVTEACLEDLGVEYLPTQANFLMHRIAGDLRTYIQRMREQGILVGRPFPPMLAYNRLSFGLPEEMERFAEVLRDFRSQSWV